MAMSDAEARFRITILDTGESFACADQQSVLNAMVSLGRAGIPSGCHGGGCGVCKIKVTAGEYRTLPMSRAHVSESEEREGVALACRTLPLSDIQLQALEKMQKCVTGRRYGFV